MSAVSHAAASTSGAAAANTIPPAVGHAEPSVLIRAQRRARRDPNRILPRLEHGDTHLATAASHLRSCRQIGEN